MRKIIFFTVLLIPFFIFIISPFFIYPAEDAAILYQFSENFANSGIISYNLNGERSEGATDFLWMIILSFLYYIGFDTFISANFISFISLLLSAFLLHKIATNNSNNIGVFILFVAILSIIPMNSAALQGFSPLFFGLSMLVSAYLFIENKQKLFFLSLLVLCLIRPDGFIVALGLFLGYFYVYSSKYNLKITIYNSFLFLILPGIIYFLSRWFYFGEFLPLPFYVKSNFDRWFLLFSKDSFFTNIKYILMSSPFIIFSFYVFIANKSKEKIILKKFFVLLFSFIFLPFFFYSMMSLSQNISDRFQYVFVLGSILIYAYSFRNLSINKNYSLIIKIVLCFWFLFYSIPTIRSFISIVSIPTEHVALISKKLNTVEPHGKMLITEAGRLPYYSKWYAVDAWGLNSPSYSKQLIQPEDVKKEDSDLIVVHASGENYTNLEKIYLDGEQISPHKKKTWNNMTDNIYLGIDKREYDLFMVPFNRYDNNSLYSYLISIRSKIRGEEEYKKGRYDAYFVKKKFKGYDKVVLLLKNNQAIEYSEYRNL